MFHRNACSIIQQVSSQKTFRINIHVLSKKQSWAYFIRTMNNE